MLKRIYIDNYKCLVNFELAFDEINLFLGPNGSGKSAVFDVLRKIQAFVGGKDRVSELFKSVDLTRWQTSPTQSFELEIEGNGGVYKYQLGIEHEKSKQQARVAHERLWFNNNPLLKFESGEAHLYRDDHSEGPTYPFDWAQSAVATLPPRDDNTRLTWFKDRLKRFIVVQINPMMMSECSQQEETQLNDKMENFVSWYRYISDDQGKAFELTAELRKILDGFNHFKFAEAGEKIRSLLLNFSGETGLSIDYGFDQLSDGERVLIALYALVYHARSNGYTLCIDEPENFISLPEIQPWLILLYDLCSDGELQSLLISHHPELIDYLAVSAGYWFDRDSNTPARAKKITEDDADGVPISKLVARGWLHG
jgi:predicted ATPase